MALITGTSNDNTLNGTAANDVINGLAGDDILKGGRGSDLLNGGSGVDTAFYADTPAGYRFGNRASDGRLTITDINAANGNEGLDTLSSIEKIQFSDRIWTVTGEFQVNTSTTHLSASSMTTTLHNGGFVVVWVVEGQSSLGSGLYGQRYNAAGVATGGEFQVSSSNSIVLYEPAITTLSDGSFVVAWTAGMLDGSNYSIYGQRYSAVGVAIGGTFQVNTTTAGSHYEPAITSLAGGGFVVTWTSDDVDGTGVYGQRYSAAGAALGAEFLINTATASYQTTPAITGLADGSFVAVWASYNQDGVDYGIYGQRYSASGVAIGGEFLVNTTTTGSQYENATTALSDGGFVVVWTSFTNNLGVVDSEIYSQRYNAAGVATGGEFLVNTTSAGFQQNSTVTGLSDGGFVVVWTSNNGYDLDIYGRRYNAAGVAIGAEFLVNTTVESQYLPVVKALNDGGFVVSWTSVNSDGTNISAQRYDVDGQAIVGSTVQGSVLADVMDFSDSKSRIKLAGGLGDDRYVLGTAGSVIVIAEQAGEGEDTVVSAKSYTLGANVENLTLTGSANINATGNNLNNVLTGNSANNLLAGGTGEDTAVFAGNANSYRFARKINGNITVADTYLGNGYEGLDTLTSIETIKFADRVWTITEESRVNTTTEGYQYQPTITTLNDGGYVVVWASNGQDGSGDGVYGQRYNSAGVAIGAEFQINTTTAGGQSDPTMTALSDGGFIVTWVSENQDGSGLGIYGQRYSQTGTRAGTEFRINTTMTNDQSHPVITALNDGGFVVAWDSNGQDGSELGIYGQRYTGTGMAASAEFRINTTTASSQYSPTITGLHDGGFVVVWSAPLQEAGTRLGVYGQRYNSTGAAIGGEFKINTSTAPISTQINQVASTVTALNDGGFVVAWGVYGRNGFGYSVIGRRYNSVGLAIGGEFQINTTTTRFSSPPTITGLSDGGFVVTWGTYGQNGFVGEVYGQRYSAAGIATGGEFLVNNTRVGNQGNPTITAQDDGGFIIAWSSAEQGGSGDDVYSKRFDANGQAIPIIKGSVLNDAMNFNDSTAAVILNGMAGNDALYGGVGNDNLSGGTGHDSLYGGAGNDHLYGDEGNDALDGDAGNDFLQGGNDHDSLDGGSGNDTLYGGTGNDSIYAGTGSDHLYGNDGNDTLDGEAGNDFLQGDKGNDLLDGGRGNDTYIFGRGGGQDVIFEADSTAGNTDILSFLPDVARDQLWFKHSGNNLEVSIIGTSDKVTISDWYSGSSHRVEEIRTADGHLLAASHVESLVSAMASFASRPAGATTLTVTEHVALDGVIGVSWS